MLVAFRQRSSCPGGYRLAWQMPACSTGCGGQTGRTPLGPCARAGAPMENGTAGWGGPPPPQPTDTSPSERWSQAWAENFPGTLTHADGELPPLPPLPAAPPPEAAPMPDWPPPAFPASEPTGHQPTAHQSAGHQAAHHRPMGHQPTDDEPDGYRPAPAEYSLAAHPAPPWIPTPPTASAPPAASTPPAAADPPWVSIPPAVPAAPAFAGPGPRVAVSHRQQRGRKPHRTGRPTPRPDDAEPSGPQGRRRATAFLCAVLAVQAT